MEKAKRTILTVLILTALIIAAYAAAFIANNVKARKEAQAMMPAGEPEAHADDDMKSDEVKDSGYEDENASDPTEYEIGRAIADYAEQYIGKKYVTGG